MLNYIKEKYEDGGKLYDGYVYSDTVNIIHGKLTHERWENWLENTYEEHKGEYERANISKEKAMELLEKHKPEEPYNHLYICGLMDNNYLSVTLDLETGYYTVDQSKENVENLGHLDALLRDKQDLLKVASDLVNKYWEMKEGDE